MIISLLILLLLVFTLPFTSKLVSRQLEFFLFFIGLSSVVISQVLTKELILHAMKEPILITIAVFLASLLFRTYQTYLATVIKTIIDRLSLRLFLFLSILLLGLASSFITAIIASLLLVMIVSHLHTDRITQIRFVVLSCFSIGLGAVLTPIGEPLATIATNKLDQDFFFLFNLLGKEVLLFILLIALSSFFLLKPKQNTLHSKFTLEKETFSTISIRTLKIYVFIMGLTLLGAGFEPLIEKFLLNMNPFSLYWLNIVSAVLDNATLAAAEISVQMDVSTIKAILMGLMISGGMLIPGNIPNIICANKLQISSKEWAYTGLPIGVLLMVGYFIIMVINI